MTLIYVLLLVAMGFSSTFFSASWQFGIAAVSVIWVSAAVLSLRGNATAQKLSRLGLCACLGLGLGMLLYGALVLYVGGQDNPGGALVSMLFAQVVFTLPCGLLLYFSRPRGL